MPLNKQPLNINFSQGLDLKTDPNQVMVGKFLAFENSVFSKLGRLQKRNGFMLLPSVSGASSLTSYNNNLLALGPSLQVYSQDTATWLNRGALEPVSVDAIPAVRTSGSITACDSAVASNKVACIVGTTSSGAYYQVIDSITGQVLLQATALPATAAVPRVFILGSYFIVTYLVTIAGTSLYYVAVPTNAPSNPGTPTSLTNAVSSLAAGYDGIVANNKLYLSWDANDGGGAIRTKVLDSSLVQSGVVAIAGKTATLMTLAADISGSTPEIYVTYYATNNAYTTVYDSQLNVITADVHTITTLTCNTITSLATAGVLQLVFEAANTYSYTPSSPGAAKSDLIDGATMTRLGTVVGPTAIARSVGLASKAFWIGSVPYFLTTYGGVYQPTYFLMDLSGNIAAKLAYSNGGGYMTTQVLPSVSINSDGVAQLAYLYKSTLTAVNKNQAVAPGNTPGIYAQLGVNLASFTFNVDPSSSEIANSLHLTGGYVTQYDGVKPVEHGFHLWPEDILVTTATGSGSISAQQYYYSFTYEWTDGQGILHRSAPSLPMTITTTTASSTNTIKVPTLRLTAKGTANPVRIVGYRWSVAQPVFYQFTSITSPTLNSTTADQVTFTDAAADASILGGQVLYTTGGVVENIAAPAATVSCLFKSRMWVVDAEDQNLLWYSKQVIEQTPVEFSDLFTLYVAPTISAQGNTGPIKALSTLDDKMVIFKKNAIYTLTGIGPDNSGASNDFTDPTFVTSTIGCDNPKSIVFMPQGLMFQSDKGIWLLSRDLSTTYIGAPVEAYNGDTVVSAVNIPGTNQVRFTLDSGVTLMYDYFVGQWGTFTGIPGVSSTLYGGLHTFLNATGQVYQEAEGSYLDGSRPVLMKFTTSWLNLAGLQGYERAYFFTLLGTYITPHKLNLSIAYDYNAAPTQVTTITPDNYSVPYGGDTLYGGGSPYGGENDVEQWRVFLQTQKCQALQVSMQESYDPSYGVPAGAGFTMSGLNFVVGLKKGYKTYRASKSVG